MWGASPALRLRPLPVRHGANPAHSSSPARSSSPATRRPYLIRHLPVSSFPELPAAVQDALNRRGCLIPQTYEAHQPENVIHASLERAGSSDWAVLCSARGNGLAAGLLCRRARISRWCWPPRRRPSACKPTTRAAFSASTGASIPPRREQIHEAQAGLVHRPPLLDHDALADSLVDHRTIYHFYLKSAWTVLEMPD